MSDAGKGSLPAGWVIAPLEELLVPLEDGRDLHHGWSPQCEKEPAGSDEEWGVLKTTAIQAGEFLAEHNKKLPNKLAPRPQHEVKAGDLLITCAGPRTRCGVPCLVRSTRPRLMLSGKMYRFRVSENHFDARYLEKYLLSHDAQMAIDAMKTGGNESGLNLTHSRFRPLPVPVAPLNEQRRISSKVEELFSRIDEGERALEQASKLVERYRQSVLKAAVTGELTRDWREARKAAGHPLESGEALLNRILTARREAWEQAKLAKMQATGSKPKDDAWKERILESKAPSTADLPELPAGWVWTSLGQMKSFSLYGPRFSSEDYDEEGYLVLRTSDISKAGRVNVTSAPKLKLSDEDFAKYRVAKGDILVTRTGSLGTLALFDDDVDAIPGAYLIQFRVPAPDVTRWYLFHFFKSPVGQSQLLKGGAGVGRPNLNAPFIEAIPIPLPPLDEQQVIVDRIEATLESLSKQVEQTQRNINASSALRQSVLRTAFSGGLVRQCHDDEPASALLERIAVKRAKSNTTAPKRGRKKKSA